MTNTIEKAAKQASSKSIVPNTRVPVKPIYINSPGETVFTSEANNAIIMGNATANTADSIKALNGSTITLAAGIGTAIKNYQVSPSSKVTLSPTYYYDSAVITISEQTNVDQNFGYRYTDAKSSNASAIAMKADEIRLFSRGSIKIVTGIDQVDKTSIMPSELNSPSHPKRDFSGISLVGNAEEIDLQPLVKGNNLEKFLVRTLNEIEKIYNLIGELFKIQSEINLILRNHTHMSDFTASELIRSVDPSLLLIDENQQKINNLTINKTFTRAIPNIENLKKNYLNKSGISYINSTYNKTN